MKLKSQLITGACVALLASAPSLAFAASKKAAAKAAASPAPAMAASPAAKAPASIPFHGKASAVDQKGKMFTIAGILSKRVFKVTDKTTITKAGAAAKFTELTDGEEVSGSYWKQADGSLDARSLKIGGKTEAEKATAAAAKMKKEAKKEAKKTADAPAASAAPAASPAKK